MAKVKGKNASSIRTRKLIKLTFAQLLQEKKSVDNITVTELVKRAGITRASFYCHFDDIYAVADVFHNELLETLGSADAIKCREDFDKALDETVELLKNNDEMYKMIVSSEDPTYLMHRLTKLLNDMLVSALTNENKYDDENRLNVMLYVNGMSAIFMSYFKGDLNKSLDDLKDYLKKTGNVLFGK